jgi:hypothetical protein
VIGNRIVARVQSAQYAPEQPTNLPRRLTFVGQRKSTLYGDMNARVMKALADSTPDLEIYAIDKNDPPETPPFRGISSATRFRMR